jgi:hypothetical protein
LTQSSIVIDRIDRQWIVILGELHGKGSQRPRTSRLTGAVSRSLVRRLCPETNVIENKHFAMYCQKTSQIHPYEGLPSGKAQELYEEPSAFEEVIAEYVHVSEIPLSSTLFVQDRLGLTLSGGSNSRLSRSMSVQKNSQSNNRTED